MLHIWLPNQRNQILTWQDKELSWKKYDSWQSLANDVTEKKACFYFPSSHLLQLDKILSVKQLKQLGETGQQYLFEEMSINAVEKLSVKHYMHSGHQRLFACSKTDIDQWQKAASLVGIKIQALLPDFLLLPITEGTTDKVYLYHDRHTTLVRQSQILGSAVGYLPLFLNQLEPVSDLVLLNAVDNSLIVADIDEVLKNNTQGANVQRSSLTLKPDAQPLRHALNFAIDSKKTEKSPYLNVTVFIVLLALTVQIGVDAIHTQQLKKASTSVQNKIEQQFQSWFPEQKLNNRITLQPQMKPYLLTANSEVDIMPLFTRVAMIVKQSNLVAKELLIDKSTIKMKLFARNRAELDELIASMSQQSITAELGSVNNIVPESNASKYTLLADVIIVSEIASVDVASTS